MSAGGGLCVVKDKNDDDYNSFSTSYKHIKDKQLLLQLIIRVVLNKITLKYKVLIPKPTVCESICQYFYLPVPSVALSSLIPAQDVNLF